MNIFICNFFFKYFEATNIFGYSFVQEKLHLVIGLLLACQSIHPYFLAIVGLFKIVKKRRINTFIMALKLIS